MRVVAWNANQGIARKAHALLALNPDIAVISECRDLPDLGDGSMISVGWTGRRVDKGLAVFVRKGFAGSVDPSWDPSREWFLPITIAAPIELDVLGVWAMHHRGRETGPRRGRIHRALEHYRDFITRGRGVVIGDFNDNVTWDRTTYPSFVRTLGVLAEMGYTSVYHTATSEQPGTETRASLYRYRHMDKPYMVDHAFIPAAWLSRLTKFEVGLPEQWLRHSDHMPLVLDLVLPLPVG